MTKFSTKLYVFTFNVLKYISLFFSFFLLLCGLMFTSTDLDITTLPTTITADNFALNILTLLNLTYRDFMKNLKTLAEKPALDLFRF